MDGMTDAITSRRKRGWLLVLCGTVLTLWGVWHFNDPFTVGNWHGLTYLQKLQFPAIAGGAMCLFGGFSYLR